MASKAMKPPSKTQIAADVIKRLTASDASGKSGHPDP